MKSAEEWMRESNDPKNYISSTRFDRSFIEQIQADALRHAAGIVSDERKGWGAGDAEVVCRDIEHAIEAVLFGIEKGNQTE